MRNLIAGALALAVSLPLAAQTAAPITRPLHIQRTVHDPISGSVSEIDEYYVGHSVIAVRGERIVIIDRAKRTRTEIDRARGTWSEAALDASPLAPRTAQRRQPQIRARELDADGTVHLELDDSELRSIAIDVDRRTPLSPSLVAAITGGDATTPLTRVVVDAASEGTERAFLPSRIERTFELAGETLVMIEELRFIAWEAPPADLIRLPDGAKREISRTERLEQALADFEENRQ